MKLKLFFGLSALFLVLALLMPVSVYAAATHVNVNPNLETHFDVKPCISVGIDVSFDDDTTTNTDGSTDIDTQSDDNDDTDYCGSGGFSQLDVSWNSGGG